jgi:hypothetical protein
MKTSVPVFFYDVIMTNKHKLFYIFWKIGMFLLGYRKGTFVEVWSDEKRKPIKSVITQSYGVSVTRTEYDFGFTVQHLEPVRGNDARFFSRSMVTKKDLDDKFVFI